MRSGSRKHVLDWVERPTFHEDSGIADVGEPVSSAAKRDDFVAKPLSDVAPGITLNQKVTRLRRPPPPCAQWWAGMVTPVMEVS